MKKIFTLILLLSGFLTAKADTWTQKANLGGTVRGASAGFSIGTKGYIGTGIDFSSSPAFFKDFWEWNQATNTWTQKANFGGTARSGAVGFSVGAKGYIATGYDANIVTRDLWEYNPATNTWTQKANYGGVGRDYAVAFSINTKGYLGTGYNSVSTNYNDFWEYDPAANSWTQKANVPGGPRSSAIGFAINGKGYIGTGYDSGPKNDFYEYDPASNVWTQKANVPGGARSDASAFAIGNKGYVCAGVVASVNKKDLWEYNPASNTWTQKLSLIGAAREDAVGFSIGLKGYIGTGYDPVFNRLKDFWEYGPDNPLPVELTTFSATQKGTSVQVKWTTASETENNFFTVEKSRDGESFEKVDDVAGNGTCSQSHAYSITDTHPLKGVWYYRLSQTDFNGNRVYAGIKSLRVDDAGMPLVIYPNPFENEINTELKETGIFAISLSTPAGKIIYHQNVFVNDALPVHINLPQIASGCYLITFQNEYAAYSQKVTRK